MRMRALTLSAVSLALAGCQPVAEIASEALDPSPAVFANLEEAEQAMKDGEWAEKMYTLQRLGKCYPIAFERRLFTGDREGISDEEQARRDQISKDILMEVTLRAREYVYSIMRRMPDEQTDPWGPIARKDPGIMVGFTVSGFIDDLDIQKEIDEARLDDYYVLRIDTLWYENDCTAMSLIAEGAQERIYEQVREW